MTNLAEQISNLKNNRNFDAIIYQKLDESNISTPCYLNAAAIIRRTRTRVGIRWSFHGLTQASNPGEVFKVISSGFYGDLRDVLKAVDRRFGTRSTRWGWVPVSYTDPNFPPNLII